MAEILVMTSKRGMKEQGYRKKQKYAANCIKSLACYDKMAMNIKVNYQQHTANQLKKLCEKFIGLEKKDRLIPIPTK